MKINVDQFALDTKMRKWQWSVYRRYPLHFFVNRLQWYLYPTLRYTPGFPIHVDFEVSSICNLKCPMCYRPHRSDKNDGIMDFDLYKKAIDECGRHNLYSIRLSWRGEPSLHPRLAEMVAYAKKMGIREVSFITNGVKLQGNLARDLVKAGLDYFSVSIDGIGETYEKIRYPSKFNDIVSRVQYMRKLRDEIGSGFPRIRINSVWSAVKDKTDEYFSIFSPVVDYITINPDYDHSLKESNINPLHICQYLYQRMTIMWDGVVPLCICDKSKEVILGNIKDHSISDLWHGDVMRKTRKIQLEGKTNTILPCSKCQRSLTKQIGDQRPGGTGQRK